MSSRRGAGEDNILAMLERDSARRSSPRLSGVRLAWYGAAAALSGILAGGVAWLAYDSHQTGTEPQAQYGAVVGAERAADTRGAAAAVIPPLAAAGSAGTVATSADASLAAVVIDERPRMRTAPPPMVMLPPQEAAAATAPATPAAAAAATPRPSAARASAAAPRASKPEWQRVLSRTPDKRVQKPVKPKAAQSRHAARRTTIAKATPVAKASGAAAARSRKAAMLVNHEPQVDGDVALISAIITYSERHRGEREEAGGCSGAKCPAKPLRP